MCECSSVLITGGFQFNIQLTDKSGIHLFPWLSARKQMSLFPKMYKLFLKVYPYLTEDTFMFMIKFCFEVLYLSGDDTLQHIFI